MKTKEGMTSQRQEDLELLALEISEAKSILREVSQQMSRIERRVRAALPSSGSPRKRPRERLDANSVRIVISRLTECARGGKQIENELRRMTVKDELAILARELGMTNTKLPPKDDLIRRISTRLRQRASVESGIREAAQEQKDTLE